jgi:twitching motility protein PilT
MPLLNRLVKLLQEKNGSDIHMLEGEKPRLRIRGDLHPIESKEHPVVERQDIEEILEQWLAPDQRRTFEQTMDVDFSVEIEGASGRVNVGLVNGKKYYLIMRYLPTKIIPLETLGIDFDMLKGLCDADKGLIIIAGETSSGKTTTAAAMLEYINRSRLGAITTIENPVEYVLKNDRCLITRREIGRDTPDFKTALRSSVRKNPDVLLIGEIRDLETANIAMSSSETGIHTFCTLHAMGALEAISRFGNIMIAEGHNETEFYLRLSETLKGIISQQLVKRVDGQGQLPLFEILNISSSEKEYIRDKNMRRLEQSLESERNISLGLCVYNLWHATPRLIDKDTVRKVYGNQFNLAMNRLEDRSGYKPLLVEM